MKYKCGLALAKPSVVLNAIVINGRTVLCIYFLVYSFELYEAKQPRDLYRPKYTRQRNEISAFKRDSTEIFDINIFFFSSCWIHMSVEFNACAFDFLLRCVKYVYRFTSLLLNPMKTGFHLLSRSSTIFYLVFVSESGRTHLTPANVVMRVQFNNQHQHEKILRPKWK